MSTKTRVMCRRHPDRFAIAENDERTLAMCAACFREWMRVEKGAETP